MPRVRSALGVGALVVALLAATAAFAAKPRKGATYTGTTSQGFTLRATVTTDGKSLRLRFRQREHCSTGPDKAGDVVFDKQRPNIRADGTIRYSKTYRDLGPIPGFEEVHTERQRVTGSFRDGGNRITGKVVITTTGKSGLTCRGVSTFSARR